jgi:phenylpropionate dioxygenase-like ring-hydroxylating dioxygenase large terminal subunit
MPLAAPAAELVTAATYERTVGASLERVWENVLDWEHLPWLHARTFESIEKLEAGAAGWRVRLVGAGGGADSEVVLAADREAGRYVVQTLAEGSGAPGSEIWTSLVADGDDATQVRVEFRVAPLDDDALAAVGRVYVGLYTTLWDEDEEMMRERAERLRELTSPPPDSPLDLGTGEELRARLPLDVVFEGRRFRVVAAGDGFSVHAAVCPHMLGPLFEADGEAGVLECPWHGYRFDAEAGRSCDGRSLRLPRAPRVSLDAQSGRYALAAPVD